MTTRAADPAGHPAPAADAAPRPAPAGRAAPAGDGWRAAVPEICIAAVVVAVAAVTGYAAAGLAGAAWVVTGAAVAALVFLRVFAPPLIAVREDGRPDDAEAIPATFTGYWRKRAGLIDGTKSMTVYDSELRRTLQHLLAARLAERHGISLQDDPGTARRLLCPRPRDDQLWYWVDPARPSVTEGKQTGIPPRTLARLIDRLEQL
jgi:hypothetical protein